MTAEECTQEQEAALAAICASCTALTGLYLPHGTALLAGSLTCLTALQQLRRLEVDNWAGLNLDKEATAALAQLPELRCLTVTCSSVCKQGGRGRATCHCLRERPELQLLTGCTMS